METHTYIYALTCPDTGSISDADRFFGGNAIKQCLSRGTNKSRGFKWNYK